MQLSGVIEIPKYFLQVLNNLFDIERKLTIHGDSGNARRNVERIKEAFEDERIFYEDPMGELFSETRIDLEATITGEGIDNLQVVEVIKPIIRVGNKTFSRVVQKGIVIVQSQNGEK